MVDYGTISGTECINTLPLSNRHFWRMTMPAQILTQSRLKELLHYDPVTGIFTWATKRKYVAANIGDVAGGINGDGYIQIKLDTVLHQAHRLAFLYVNGKFPTSQVDHINHVRADNRFNNLRKCTNRENTQNQGVSSNNTSGVTGVSWHVCNNNWNVIIGVNMKSVYVGSYSNFDDAVSARKAAEVKHGFHENHGKFMDQ